MNFSPADCADEKSVAQQTHWNSSKLHDNQFNSCNNNILLWTKVLEKLSGHFHPLSQAANIAKVVKWNVLLCSVSLPITAFTDDLHLKVVDPAGGWDGVGGPYRRCIFRGFAMTLR